MLLSSLFLAYSLYSAPVEPLLVITYNCDQPDIILGTGPPGTVRGRYSTLTDNELDIYITLLNTLRNDQINKIIYC